MICYFTHLRKQFPLIRRSLLTLGLHGRGYSVVILFTLRADFTLDFGKNFDVVTRNGENTRCVSADVSSLCVRLLTRNSN